MIRNLMTPQYVVECFKCKTQTKAFDTVVDADDYAFNNGWNRKKLTSLEFDDWRCPDCQEKPTGARELAERIDLKKYIG